MAISFNANSQRLLTPYVGNDSVKVAETDINEHMRNFFDSQQLRKEIGSLEKENLDLQRALEQSDSTRIAAQERAKATEEKYSLVSNALDESRKELKGTKVWSRLGVVGIVGAFVLGIVIGK